ncbi:MAG: choice-of-anchor tandem repeat GloVer-containing protein [Thermoanaerobaculia bacterium]
MLDGTGNLYGVTSGVGKTLGVVYRMKVDGSSYTVLHAFTSGTDGDSAIFGLVMDSTGFLYGATLGGGGQDSGGTLFKIRTDGTGYAILHSFPEFVGDGVYPSGPLIADGAGNLYGSTGQGGANGYGTVFSIHTDGTSYSILKSFAGGTDGGQGPVSPLVADGAGHLYGAAGDGANGIVFSFKIDGGVFQILHSFSGADGLNPAAGLLLDGSGTLFGVTQGGGAANLGAVFSIQSSGSDFSVLHSFSDDPGDGAAPEGGLTFDSAGRLYGTTTLGGSHGFGSIFALNKDGGGFALLNSFFEKAADGDQGTSCVLPPDGSGSILVTTAGGGPGGGGVIAKLSTGGAGYTILHSFDPGVDGPEPSLVADVSGIDYGTTVGGGPGGFGTVFRMKTDGSSFQILHPFTGGTDDGERPNPGLSLDGSGFLYGTASQGGSGGKGVVFRVKSDGTGFAILHSFTGGPSDGDSPFGPVVMDSAGNLYGSTIRGGSSNTGTIFKMSATGTRFIVLHSVTDAMFPGALTLDGQGTLYGSTAETIFRMRTDGTGYEVLKNLVSVTGSLILDGVGNLYGVTMNGGVGNVGTVFAMRVDGTAFTLLHGYTGDPTDGAHPTSGPCLDGSGNLYGTMAWGGILGGGILFKLNGATPGGVTLGTPVISSPVEGQVFTQSRVNLAWGAVSGAAGYDLRILDNSSGAIVYSGNLVGLNSTAVPIDLPNGNLTFQVRACSGGFSDANCGLFATVDFTINVLPPASTRTKFYTLTPCRIVDTRNAAGLYGGPALSAGVSRVFKLAGQCGIPTNAKAASVNITVVTPTDPGELKLNPTGADPQIAASISFAAGRTIANNAMAFLGNDGAVSVFDTQVSGTTHFIIDVNGYYK